MREIGRGGMGVVYLARDMKLMRHVAVKRLTSKSSNTKVVQRRFLREAQTIASLQHINIVAIYDIGQDEKGNYIGAPTVYEQGRQFAKNADQVRLTAAQNLPKSIDISRVRVFVKEF